MTTTERIEPVGYACAWRWQHGGEGTGTLCLRCFERIQQHETLIEQPAPVTVADPPEWWTATGTLRCTECGSVIFEPIEEAAAMTEGQQTITRQERARLERLYPLLVLDFLPENKYGIEAVRFRPRTRYPSSSWGCVIKQGRVQDAHRLDDEHMKLKIADGLMLHYPHLFISASTTRDGVHLTAWTRMEREHEGVTYPDDDTAIGSVALDDPELHATLQRWEVEATRAAAEGWFYCSGHGRAEQQHEGQWFHFAGRYCKTYGEEHPGQRQEAARETYN